MRDIALALKLSLGSRSIAFVSLQNALNLFKEVAGRTGVPGLQEGIKGFVILLDAVQKTARNDDDLISLAQRVQDLNAMLKRVLDSNKGPLSEAMVDRINCLSESWKSTGARVQDILSHNYFKRVLARDQDALEIASCISAIHWSIESFLVENMLAIEFALDEHIGFTRNVMTRIEDKIERNQEGIERNQEGIEEIKRNLDGGLNPPNAIAAHFRCKGGIVCCLPGTRVKVLEEVFQWISRTECPWDEHRPIPSDSPGLGRCMESPCIFWLNGVAGSGKTTIAFTCAEHCQDKGILAANFFCSRDNANCSNIKLIFTTIAYQMGKFCAEFKVVLSDILRSDPEIVYSDVSYQLQKLIVEPLLAVGEKFPRSVIVIDALDECKDHNATSTILASLSQYIDKLFPLQFFITSRPIHKITRGFQDPHLSYATRPLILHQVDLDVIESDIQYYLEWHFDEIKDQYHIPAPWPSSADIETLTHMSSGLFIFAATAVRFIGMADPGDPMAQLEVLLQRNPVAGESPQQHLDQLYSQVLKSTFPNLSDQLAAKLHLILGTVALLQDPLPLDQLEDLIGYRIYHHCKECVVPLHIKSKGYLLTCILWGP